MAEGGEPAVLLASKLSGAQVLCVKTLCVFDIKMSETRRKEGLVLIKMML